MNILYYYCLIQKIIIFHFKNTLKFIGCIFRMMFFDIFIFGISADSSLLNLIFLILCAFKDFEKYL